MDVAGCIGSPLYAVSILLYKANIICQEKCRVLKSEQLIMEHIIKYYPVGNGDCSLIKLDDKTTIIIDCQIAEITKENKDTTFDVKEDLLKELQKDEDERPYVDLFVSTHPHSDHCDGFEKNFFCGKLDDYDNEDDKDKIIIGELWVSPMALSNTIDESAKPIRVEAKRRRKIYDDDVDFEGEYGSTLRIIGYDKDKEFDSRYGYIPGTAVDTINDVWLSNLTIFIHAPFKDSVEKGKDRDDKNEVSIVLHLTFTDDQCNTVCRVLTAGDAEYDVWEKIVENNKNEENLKWNIFLAPHHCSWTFFNETTNKDEVKESSKTILEKQLPNAHIVTSCTSIKHYDPKAKPPPHKEAADEYKKRLNSGEDHFLNTADEYDITKKPIVFKITENGKVKEKVAVSSIQSAVTKQAPRAGRD